MDPIAEWSEKISLMGQIIIEQAEVRIQVITYIEVHRQRARELLVRTQTEGQNQKVNIKINTTGRPNINNTQDKTNIGRRSHKIKTEKTNWHRPMKDINTRLTGHAQVHRKQARPRKEPGKRKQETGMIATQNYNRYNGEESQYEEKKSKKVSK